ncbi:hypothetical protein KK473_28330, partial [Klebsiella pneumoniae]|uniref:hypothetical protein n=1 Tax=Klebsiella pneumoniae TaxID=573 RepID=UPI001BE01F5B
SNKAVHRGLIPKYDGPFKVIQKVGNVAYKLKLLERLKVHPTFHVSFLKPYYEDQDTARAQKNKAPPTIRKQFGREVGK